MSVNRLAHRYAKSLIGLARERDELDEILGDVRELKAALGNEDFRLLVKSPIIQASKKQEVVRSIFSEHLKELTFTFLLKMIDKSREKFLPEIIDAFEQQYREIKGITIVRLITATPLNDETENQLKKALAESKTTDQTIEINTEVNPDIIGGFVIEFDDKLYDASVKHKLDDLRQKLTGRAETA